MTTTLREYFENRAGHGVLATADVDGRPNVAIFASPHILDDNLVGFIMPDRKTHQNLVVNPNAAYLFHEDTGDDGSRWQGKRLRLSKVSEEKDTERVKTLRRRTYSDERDGRYLVTFKVEEVLPLVGAG